MLHIKYLARTVKTAVITTTLMASSLLTTQAAFAGGGIDPCQNSTNPVASMSATPDHGVQSVNVAFDASYSEGCSAALTDYSWDFGDGTNANGVQVDHTYTVGNWQAILTVTDASGLTASRARTITVKAGNTAPVAQDDSVEVLQGKQTVLTAGANDTDPDGDVLQWNVETQPSHGTVTMDYATGDATYTAQSNYVGSDSFTYSVDDGYGGTAIATVHITVDPQIIANDDTATTNENTAVTIPVLANDTSVTGDPLAVEYAYDGWTGNTVTIDSQKQNVVFTPNTGWSGTATLHYTVQDVNHPEFTANSTVQVTVLPVNRAPVATNGTYSGPEDGMITGNVLDFASDPDNDALTVSALTQPQHGVLNLNSSGSLSYKPAAGFVGVDSFTYQVKDSSGATASATLSLNVFPVNHAPVAHNDSVTTNEDTAATVNTLANDTDSDGDALTLTSVSQPQHGTVVKNANGTVTYTPAANYNGADSFTYQIADPSGATNTATVAITVTSVNDLPTASFNWTATKQRNVTFTATASDVDGTIARYDWNFGDGSTSSVSSTTQQHTYRKSGTYTVSLTVTDNDGGQTTYSQNISL